MPSNCWSNATGAGIRPLWIRPLLQLATRIATSLPIDAPGVLGAYGIHHACAFWIWISVTILHCGIDCPKPPCSCSACRPDTVLEPSLALSVLRLPPGIVAWESTQYARAHSI